MERDHHVDWKLSERANECFGGNEKIKRAYKFAFGCHDGQMRKSGEPYISHCVEVLQIIKNEWDIEDEDCLVAALLHDVVEDCEIGIDQIRLDYGEGVAELVDGVTKLDTGSDRDTLKKVLTGTYLNPKVAIVKLADRLHNMRTMDVMPRQKQITKATETLRVYTRLAESLGIWVVKNELEDLCYKYVDKDGYLATKRQIETDPRLGNFFISNISSELEELMVENGFLGRIEMRRNGLYSLKEKQKKMALAGRCRPDGFEEINDVVSARIRVKNLDDCYRLLGVIHKEYGEMVDYGRFDEFIGRNKRINGYEAMQTTINFTQGPVEIAIVTDEMEEFNNWGVVNLIREGRKDLRDYVLKLIFTPKGSIRFLPKRATGVDFAAEISPRVLAEAKAMLVDGKRQDLSHVLPNAATINIILSDETRRAPILGLENYCLAPARRLIAEQRRLEERDSMVELGKKKLEEILLLRGLLVLTDLGDRVRSMYYKFGSNGYDNFCFMVGNLSISVEEIGRELDERGVSKEKLGLTSVRLTGEDKSGILINLITIISSRGGNIVHIEQTMKASRFSLRIVTKGLSSEDEAEIRQIIEGDERFETAVLA